jgi:cytochrome c oxidase subunit 2
MSIHVVPDGWWKAPHGNERTWIGLALVWCVVLFLAMPYWHFKGKQNSTGEACRTTPEAFVARVDRFIAATKVDEVMGVPICQPPPGSDVYLLAEQFRYTPVLKLVKGQEYRLHLSSRDVQHGFSLLPLNMNFQAVPGYDHVLTLTPTQSGTFDIICNEFCGVLHHAMTGRILVD